MKLSATLVGILLPWFISRLGHGPSFRSGLLATIFQEIFRLMVYFAAMTFLMF